jgi:hypothetical protein
MVSLLHVRTIRRTRLSGSGQTGDPLQSRFAHSSPPSIGYGFHFLVGASFFLAGCPDRGLNPWPPNLPLVAQPILILVPRLFGL